MTFNDSFLGQVLSFFFFLGVNVGEVGIFLSFISFQTSSLLLLEQVRN